MSYGDLLSEEELRALDDIVRLPSAHPGVLLVDEEESTRADLAEWIIDQGIACMTAGSVEEAMALLATRPSIGLLVNALRLHGDSDGLELVRQVRRSARATLPVIILSGDAAVEDAIEAMHMKVVDFLLEPVDPSVLVTLIRNELGVPPPQPSRRRARHGPAKALSVTCG
ncbi:response regulator [Pseudomonas sp. RIT-PI-AD]|uniref:response regulator n=1 Tax=Pseudomonas sp. RIT-PI-AD TaxID=3035294 RepID=UPI0021DA551A|nr:response regulator [Pseudomonas sp. RIT-PI-AD]